ncbi:HNH endonuclease [Nannocystis radixulma]|uniref:HNH endonuclease n=1 Tax=Nannocystis radixulma TaxID=2995305 RepID=UPI00358DA1A5
MDGSKPHHLSEAPPRARLFPSDWKDEAIYILYDHEKQGVYCSGCKRLFSGRSEVRKLQGDHIVAWARGGLTTWENMQLLCAECNYRKSNL